MFILRRCLQSGIKHNFELGDNYTIIHRDYLPEDFKQMMDTMGLVDFDIENRHHIIAWVTGDIKQFPVYKNDEAYIMTDSGKTFEKVMDNRI